MEQPYVTLKIENKVGYIEFYHPDKNAMSSNLLSQLTQTIENAGVNEAINVIVLKSGGARTFCAGASFKELIAIDDAKTGEQFFSGFATLINVMRKCPKLIIGRVQGKTVGGGVGLAATTDYCLATQYASIKLSELSIGIGPFVIEPVVSKKMGKTAMSQMTINAERFYTAEYAKSKGLYDAIFDTTEQLDEAVKVLAEKLSGYNPEALKEMKKVFWENTEHWDALLKDRARISGKLVLSAFTKNTLKRFK
ncbi:MAG: enoyl-CoA hydratase/isomerase family protein [Flavobacteriaceae bacterium]